MSFRSTIESLSKTMDDMGITEIDFERNYLFGLFNRRIHLSKQSVVAVSGDAVEAAAPVINEETHEVITGHVLKSPMVGVAYLAPEPGAKPFVKVGATVHAGDTVALVEAMKTFNPIKSDVDGVVKEVLVADAAAVEFDQPLIVIE
ncbi:MAG: acetyl-CoA carboxylase biotin carboxyl carrier protein subunit [Alphaproteobacteria bacterium]|nr:acetyl-CoA carboxylase biotin carboxyl carrier protein subunit [Alphaproteobacteria bacterium]